MCLLFLLCVDCFEAGLSGDQQSAGFKTEDQQWAGFKTEDQQWAGFKTMYGKKYKSWEEETYRRKIWEEELQFIAEHNYEKQVTNKLS